ncbi:MAG: phenylalanine--tRNA ligase subunit beta [bacterium]
MPKIKIDKTTLYQLMDFQGNLEQLQNLAWSAKAEISGSEQDEEITIDFADTNRPDLWSVEGLSRQLKIFQQGKEILYPCLEKAPSPEAKVFVDSLVTNIRPYIGMFLCKLPPITEKSLKNLIQTQEKLAENYGKRRKLVSIGIYPAEKINFPVHYRAVESDQMKFVPLGGEQPMTLGEIIEKHPKGIEYAYTLQDAKLFPVIIDDQGQPLSFAPIINSRTTGEVTVGDSYIAVEATGMTKKMVDLVLVILALNLTDQGGEITRMEVIAPHGKSFVHPVSEREEISVYVPHAHSLLGQEDLGIEIISSSLKKMGYRISRSTPNEIFAQIPIFRQDVMHEVDLIEDIAIALEYNEFSPLPLEEYTSGGLSPTQRRANTLRQISIGLGFVEFMGNMLTSKETLELITQNISNPVEIDNPMTKLYNCLRDYLFPGLVDVEAHNSKAEYPHYIFEVGEVNKKYINNQLVETETLLSAAYLIANPEATFSQMHSVLSTIFSYLSLDFNLRELEIPFLISGRSAEILVTDQTSGKSFSLGFLGEVHPRILDKLGIHMPTVIMELENIENLFTTIGDLDEG